MPICFVSSYMSTQPCYEGATFSPVEHLENTRVESPRFGIAWHVLDDLVVEEILLQSRGDGSIFVWSYIGS